LAFTDRDESLLSLGADGEVRVWDVATGKLLRKARLTGTGADAPQKVAATLHGPYPTARRR
jgi:hypothetical protein